jgi:hypothetical protein
MEDSGAVIKVKAKVYGPSEKKQRRKEGKKKE